MGEVYADITLYNGADWVAVKMGIRSQEDVRKMSVRALVDSGATTLAINEEIKNQLGLFVWDTQEVELANGSLEKYDFVGPVEVRFKNRKSLCRAIVMPNVTEVLLGAIPMEEMDVVIDMKNQELILPPERPYLAKIRV